LGEKLFLSENFLTKFFKLANYKQLMYKKNYKIEKIKQPVEIQNKKIKLDRLRKMKRIDSGIE